MKSHGKIKEKKKKSKLIIIHYRKGVITYYKEKIMLRLFSFQFPEILYKI